MNAEWVIDNRAALKWSQSCKARGTALYIVYFKPGNVKKGKITFQPSLNKFVPPPPTPQKTVCKDIKKAVIVTTGLMAMGLKIKNII